MNSKLRKMIHIIQKGDTRRKDEAIEIYQKCDRDPWAETVLFGKSFEHDLTGDIIKDRRSIRKYTDKKVERDKLMQILESGLYAPSSCNRQPIVYKIITGQEAGKHKAQRFIKGADVVVLVLVDMDVYEKQGEYFSLLDAGAAIQNMLLKAHMLGLGACWVNTAENETVKFDIPKKYRIASMVCLGYPAESPYVNRKKMEII